MYFFKDIYNNFYFMIDGLGKKKNLLEECSSVGSVQGAPCAWLSVTHSSFILLLFFPFDFRWHMDRDCEPHWEFP